ncbi:MAG: hypothetical protein M3044_05335 [Thermoproteota archaeon]|nr:hypothetical protein [Thermoproteota archaeon]
MVNQQEKMNRMSEYSTTISILEINTNQTEFGGDIDKRINQDLIENLSKEDHCWLLIDYLVHLGLEKIQTNPLNIAVKHKMQSKNVRSFINELQ